MAYRWLKSRTQTRPRGPDFIVIGAQRAGTTWLYKVLRQHPAVWLPPVKELHYFDKPHVRRAFLHEKEWSRLSKLRGAVPLDMWQLQFGLGLRCDEWYARLFQKAQRAGFLAGEITPAYATLDEEIFRRIRRMNPAVKIAFVMRDPVDRSWSAVNNDYKKGLMEGCLTAERALEWSRSQGTALRSAYTDTIKRLNAAFPSHQLHFCFFDDLRDRPKRFIAELLSFFGADSSKLTNMKFPEATNSAAAGKPAPIEFERAMAREYLPLVKELCDIFEGPPHNWRARYNKLLAPTPSRGERASEVSS